MPPRRAWLRWVSPRLDACRRRHGEVRGEQRDVGAAPSCLLGESDAHPAGRAVADVAHGIEWLAGPAGADENVLSREWPFLAEQHAAPREDLLRLGHASETGLSLGELSLLRADQLDPSLAQAGGVLLRGRVLPHADVHRRRGEHGAAEGEHRLREHAVGEAVRELRERVRRERGDHEQVRLDEVRIEVARHLLPRESLERLRGDERLRLGSQKRRDVMPVPDQQTAELARLVGGDTT